MREPSPEALSLLLAVIRSPAASRRAMGRLRPVVVGRPHPLHRLPRWQVDGVVRAAVRGDSCEP